MRHLILQSLKEKMVIKVKEYVEKTRHIKNNDKSKKNYQIKRNLIILSNFSKIIIDTELKFSAYT